MDINLTSAEDKRRYWLAEDVYWGDVGDGLIFLDLRGNRFTAIEKREAIAVSQLVHGWPGSTLPSGLTSNLKDGRVLAEHLTARGLLTNCMPHSPMANETLVVTEALSRVDVHTARPSISLEVWREFTLAFLRSYLLYSVFSLRATVSYLRQRRATRSGWLEVNEDRLVGSMAQFSRLRPFYYTSIDRCLLDSLTLSEFLRRQGIDSTFVLGVKTRPFESHCWIQCGGTVVNDTYENVASFVPLLGV
jgi:Transglutaminase-like superfamily